VAKLFPERIINYLVRMSAFLRGLEEGAKYTIPIPSSCRSLSAPNDLSFLADLAVRCWRHDFTLALRMKEKLGVVLQRPGGVNNFRYTFLIGCWQAGRHLPFR